MKLKQGSCKLGELTRISSKDGDSYVNKVFYAHLCLKLQWEKRMKNILFFEFLYFEKISDLF